VHFLPCSVGLAAGAIAIVPVLSGQASLEHDPEKGQPSDLSRGRQPDVRKDHASPKNSDPFAVMDSGSRAKARAAE